MPVQLIEPASHSLLDGAPHGRREFMDWGLFHLEPEFLEQWQRYRRALVQRNALLKSECQRELEAWNCELAHYGTMVAERRKTYLERLQPHFLSVLDRFLRIGRCEFRFCAGWDASRDLLTTLHSDQGQDCRYGFTRNGPHRGDFVLRIDGRRAAEVVSRGQMKLIVLALKLAQVRLLSERCGGYGSILIDDLASELDAANRSALLTFLMRLEAQVFITSTTALHPAPTNGVDCAVFIMKRGRLLAG